MKCGQAVPGISTRNAGEQLSSREITTLKLSSLSHTEKETMGHNQLYICINTDRQGTHITSALSGMYTGFIFSGRGGRKFLISGLKHMGYSAEYVVIYEQILMMCMCTVIL